MLLAVFCSGSTNQSYRLISTSIGRNAMAHHHFSNPIRGHICYEDKVFQSKA